MKTNNIGLIGLGAIGAPLAIAFNNCYQDHFFLIAEGKRKEKIQKGILINNQLHHFTTITPHSKKNWISSCSVQNTIS